MSVPPNRRSGRNLGSRAAPLESLLFGAVHRGTVILRRQSQARLRPDNGIMAIKAVAVDDQDTQHLIIGLNRDDVFTLPGGVAITLTENSVVLLFAETDEDLEKRFPPKLRPI